MTSKIFAAALFAAAVTPATETRADHYLATADPQVVQAINELMYAYGGACQMGNPQACNLVNLMQQEAGNMLSAGYECQTAGNQQACQYYQSAYQQLSQVYNYTQQALAAGQMQQAPSYNQSTHAQRMQQIHNWGQQRLQYGRQSMQLMEQRQKQFLQNLNN
ncbi:MAG: hypothetical protein AAGJ28_11560 [Pseudomonadota bacterium]